MVIKLFSDLINVLIFVHYLSFVCGEAVAVLDINENLVYKICQMKFCDASKADVSEVVTILFFFSLSLSP